MQRDQMAGMDLTADPDGSCPSPSAKVVRLARRRRPPDGGLDLAGDEDPSGSGELQVNRDVYREASTLALVVRIWKAVEVSFRYDVQGAQSWVPSLCTIVLMSAIAATMLVPRLTLPETSPEGLRIVVAATSGCVVLVTGAGILLYQIRKKSKF
jgi:hypothetical protein